MKRIIIWLAKVFKVDLTIERIVIKEVIKEVEKQVALEGTIEGDLTISGNLVVNGYLYVKGEVTAYDVMIDHSLEISDNEDGSKNYKAK